MICNGTFQSTVSCQRSGSGCGTTSFLFGIRMLLFLGFALTSTRAWADPADGIPGYKHCFRIVSKACAQTKMITAVTFSCADRVELTQEPSSTGCSPSGGERVLTYGPTGGNGRDFLSLHDGALGTTRIDALSPFYRMTEEEIKSFGPGLKLNPGCFSGCKACPKDRYGWDNGNCYLCPEGTSLKQAGDKAPGACTPVCTQLPPGASVEACQTCLEGGGGVACRCDSFSDPAEKQACFCAAGIGGDACNQPWPTATPTPSQPWPTATPTPLQPWPTATPTSTPSSTPPPSECQPGYHRWSDDSCQFCPESDPDCQCDLSKLRPPFNPNRVFGEVLGRRTPIKDIVLSREDAVGPRALYPGDRVTIEGALRTCKQQELQILPKEASPWTIKGSRDFSQTYSLNYVDTGKEPTSLNSVLKPRRTADGVLSTTDPRKARAWAAVTRVCPAASLLEPLGQCPGLVDKCSADEKEQYTDLIADEEAALRVTLNRLRPSLPLPGNTVDGIKVAISGWLGDTASKRPPFITQTPLDIGKLYQTEKRLEELLATQASGSVNMARAVELAAEAAGCRARCSHRTWRLALFAGHNVLKNVASLQRQITPCENTTVNDTGSWLPYTYEGDKISDYAENLCKAYSAPDGERVQEWNRSLLQQKYRKYKLILEALEPVRPGCFDTGNHIGPYYHLFAMGIINHYGGPVAASLAAVTEFGAQLIKKDEGKSFDWPYALLNSVQNRALIMSSGLKTTPQ